MENKEKEISIIDLWHTFLRNIWFILITTFIFFLISVIIAWFIETPKYSSTADIMVQVEQDTPSNPDPNFDLVNAFRLIDTIAELMKKEVVLENALNRLEMQGYNELSVSYLRHGLSIRTSSSSYFINISFLDENNALAQIVVDAVIEAVIEETNQENAFPVLTDKLRRTSFASDAIYDSPNKILYMIVGLILGSFVSIGVVLLKENLSTKFKNKDEIEEALNLQILGVIPKMENKELKNVKR